ncbi:MAG TPA: bacteriocin fulvocin C-related protein [Marinilabiliaceae bacterium]|nr:bacteriocin fulvocin C-related protein [Marinilabiliaceae bacterium]
MKRLVFILFFGLYVCLSTSCNKEWLGSQAPEIGSIDLQVNNAIMSLKTPDARQTSFANHLSPEEKCEFVKNRFNSIISELNFDKKQIETLNEIRVFLEPEIYVNDSPLNLSAKEFIITWEKKARSVFSKELLAYIFSFKKLEEFFDVSNNTSQLSRDVKDCDCATKSDYCSGGKDCKVRLCAIDTYSCGTLFLYHCDGICENTVQNP